MSLEIVNDCDLDEILREKFLSEFRKGYITLRGVCLPEGYEKYAQGIEEFEVREDDIWVCSFPKTGTTWTQEMVWCIANDLDYEGAKVLISQRFPFLEYSALFDYTAAMSRIPELKLQEAFLESLEFVKKQASPRFIKTHLPFHLLPRQLRTGEKNAKIIYVTRNPKDTCVSYYHHCILMEGYRGDFHEFCKLFLRDKLSYAPYWDHVDGYWSKKSQNNILFLMYEDMKSGLSSVIEKTAEYLNKSLSSDQINSLIQHLSFDKMKLNPAVNYEDDVELNKTLKLINVKGTFIRSGRVNQWKGEMSQSTIDQFDKLTKQKLAKEFQFYNN